MQKKLKKSSKTAAAAPVRRGAPSRPAAGIFEPLEQRKMLSVSVDSAGWTQIGKSSDSRVIYVSNSQGSDSNSGTSQDNPVKSLSKAKSLLRSGMPDHMLLKRGDTWYESLGTWNKSGRSDSEPMVIGAYGSSDDRPVLKTGSSYAFNLNGKAIHDVAIVGLHMHAHTRDPESSSFTGTSGDYGIRLVGSADGFLIEDSVIDAYKGNIAIDDWNGKHKDIKIRRNVITDSYSTRSASGIYAEHVDRLTIEENVIDRNAWSGWSGKIDGYQSVPDHGIYTQATVNGLVVKGNIISNNGSHGLQARGGGVIKDNLFIKNPIGMSFGHVNGAPAEAGGVVGEVSDNVFLETRNIDTAGRGWGMGIEVGNTRRDGNTKIRNNIFANDGVGSAPALSLAIGSNVHNASEAVGINDLTIEQNVVYNWYRAVNLSSSFQPGGSGSKALNDLTVRDNEFQGSRSNKFVSHSSPYSSSEERWEGNRYYDDASSSTWFNLGSTSTSLSSWKSKVESSASGSRIGYADAGRDAGEYNASIGGSDSNSAFIGKAKQQSKAGGWRGALTAAAANDYIRAGYNMSGGGTSTDDGGSTDGGATPGEIEEEETPVTSPSNDFPVAESVVLSKSKLVVRFSEDVSDSLRAWDFVVTQVGVGSVKARNCALSYDRSTNTATLTWPGHNGGDLAGGEYKVQIYDQGVTDSDGNHFNDLKGDYYKSHWV